VEKIEVIVCTNYDSNDELIVHSPPSKIADILKMIFSLNPQKDDKRGSKANIPFIPPTEAPLGVEPDNLTTLREYIWEKRCVGYYNLLDIHSYPYNSFMKPPTLYEHLWILNKLVTMEKIDYDLFSEYIVNVTCRKMHHRLNHKFLSMPYLLSLKSVNMEKIVFLTSESEFSPIDKRFFNEYLGLIPGGETEYPNIRKQLCLIEEAEKAEAEKARLGEPAHLDEQHELKLYTQDTYKEFNTLFIKCLEVFEKALAGLQSKGVSTAFQIHLRSVRYIGKGLQLLTKGTVLVMHLKTIESSLKEHHRVKTIPDLKTSWKKSRTKTSRPFSPRLHWSRLD
jgi:hypothetical protein